MSLRFRFTRPQVWQLFLVCASPTHFWTFITFFFEVDLIEKRNLAYYAGFGGYLLMLALLEGLVFLGFILLLSYLFPKKWEGNLPIIMASVLVLVIGLWGICNQLYFLFSDISPAWFEWIMLRVHYRQHQLYPILLVAVIASAALPVWLIPKYKQVQDILYAMIEKLTLLASFYLVIDALLIVMALLRNFY